MLGKWEDSPIIRINNIELVSHDDDGIYCEGTVKYNNAEKKDFEFRRFIDEDGDVFIGITEL